MDDRDGVITLRPQVPDMPDYGRLQGLLSKGTMLRYRIELDQTTGIGTWWSGDEPTRFRLPGHPDDGAGLPEVARGVIAVFNTPSTLRTQVHVGPSTRSTFLLASTDGRCIARSFTYLADKNRTDWAPVTTALPQLGIPVTEDHRNMHALNKSYRGTSRIWFLLDPVWLMITVVATLLLLVAIGFGIAALAYYSDPDNAGPPSPAVTKSISCSTACSIGTSRSV